MSASLNIFRFAQRAIRPRIVRRAPTLAFRRVLLCGGAFTTGFLLHQQRARCDTELITSLAELAPVIDANMMLKQFVHFLEENEDEHISLETLKLLFRHAGIDDDALAENIFRIMDWDANGYLDQGEVAAVLTLFQSGTEKDKFKFLFRCLDLDGSNSVDKLEFRSILTALLDAKFHLHGLHDKRTPEEFYTGIQEEEFHTVAKYAANKIVRDIFFFADKNNDGELSMKEFLHWCQRGGRDVDMVSELLRQTLHAV